MGSGRWKVRAGWGSPRLGRAPASDSPDIPAQGRPQGPSDRAVLALGTPARHHPVGSTPRPEHRPPQHPTARLGSRDTPPGPPHLGHSRHLHTGGAAWVGLLGAATLGRPQGPDSGAMGSEPFLEGLSHTRPPGQQELKCPLARGRQGAQEGRGPSAGELSPPDSRLSAEARGSVSSLSAPPIPARAECRGTGPAGSQQKLLVTRAPSPNLSVQQDLLDTLPSTGSVDHDPGCPRHVLGHYPRG